MPLLSFAKRIIPPALLKPLLPLYHAALAYLGALFYRFPARSLLLIAVTGTKGKSSVCEILNSLLKEAGLKTALASTIHFEIAGESRPNLFKMTMPGRFFLQKFLRQAVSRGCTHAIIEMTSEGVRQYRHRFIPLDALIFTNIAREHIESHGSFEKYKDAKFKLGLSLAASPKRPRVIVANADDREGARYLSLPVEESIPFGLSDTKNLSLSESSITFSYASTEFSSPLRGAFNVLNILAALKLALRLGISKEAAKNALLKLSVIKGRVEYVDAGQNFLAVVDYAHTPDSLRELYEAFPGRRKICVLGNTGGGRDRSKRPAMAAIADSFCDVSILTNEDPYDEDPRTIVEEMKKGFARQEPRVIMSRREAIRMALSLAGEGDAVLITGKGTDPYIMEASGKKTPWSDAAVVKEELRGLGYQSAPRS